MEDKSKELGNKEGAVKPKKPIAPSKLLKMAKEERAAKRRRERERAKKKKIRDAAKALELQKAAEVIGKHLEKEAEYAEKHKNRTPLIVSNVPRAKVRQIKVDKPKYDVYIGNPEDELKDEVSVKIAAHQPLILSGNFNFLTQHVKQKLGTLLNYFSDTANFCLYLLYVDTLEITYPRKDSLINLENSNFKVSILERKFVRKHNVFSTIEQFSCKKSAFSYIKDYNPDKVRVCFLPYVLDTLKASESIVRVYNDVLKKYNVKYEMQLANSNEVFLPLFQLVTDDPDYKFFHLDSKLYEELNLKFPDWLKRLLDKSLWNMHGFYMFHKKDYYAFKKEYVENNYTLVQGINISFLRENLNHILL
jgi:hypothetical protein